VDHCEIRTSSRKGAHHYENFHLQWYILYTHEIKLVNCANRNAVPLYLVRFDRSHWYSLLIQQQRQSAMPIKWVAFPTLTQEAAQECQWQHWHDPGLPLADPNCSGPLASNGWLCRPGLGNDQAQANFCALLAMVSCTFRGDEYYFCCRLRLANVVLLGLTFCLPFLAFNTVQVCKSAKWCSHCRYLKLVCSLRIMASPLLWSFT